MEYEIVNEYGTKLITYFTSAEFYNAVHTLSIIVLLYFIILDIILIACTYKIYSNEKINKYYSLIPIYHFYHITKMIKLPYYLIFIPIVNLITLRIIPYKISKIYNVSKRLNNICLLFPLITLPYIVFSNKYKILHKKNIRFLRTVKDVENIENKLENDINNNAIYDDEIDYQVKDNNQNFESTIDKRIDTIEKNAIQDDFYNELIMLESNNEKKNVEIKDSNEDNQIVDNYEIQDLFDNNDIRNNSIETIENKIEEAKNRTIIDNANYKEYKEDEKKLTTIAFGGIEQNDKTEQSAMQRKDDKLRCPHCGSELDNNSITCPGCGKNVAKNVYDIKLEG